MILKLRYYGDPILRKKAEPIAEINAEIKQLAADMIETINALPNAIGLAAPQVGKSVALFVVQYPEKGEDDDKWIPGPIEIFINPKLLEVSDEGWFYSEGCLSIPTLYEEVPRPLRIKIQYQNLDGQLLVRELEGYEARMLLHENDHLNGVLFIDRLSKDRRKAVENQLRTIKNKYYLQK